MTLPKFSSALRSFHSAVQLLKNVERTTIKYPDLKRGNFSVPDHKDIEIFRNVVGAQNVLTEPDDVAPYNVDWMRSARGSSRVVVRPKTTAQVCEILKYCNLRNIAVSPQGGNTGLVAGSVPVFDEVILSLGRMSNVLSVDELTGIAIVEAGCVLEKLEKELSYKNLTVPLDLGAKGSCQIGGNISTNAGGIRLLRYGNLHGSVLGVTAVLANGQVLDCLSTNKKDNTGYDLKQLFIGSEGTLGVVTQVALHCPTKPSSIQVGFLGSNSFDDVLKTMRAAKLGLGEILSSCEFIDQASLDCVVAHLGLRPPIEAYPFYVLIETSGSNEQHDAEKLNQLLSKLLDDGTVADGTLATDPSHIKNLWALRERITEALSKEGYGYKYDLSIPVRQFYQLVEDMRLRLDGRATRCCGYGHLGDGNLHLNVTSPEYDPEIFSLLEPFVYDWVFQRGGSISAEHGLGFRKRNYIGYSKSSSAVEWMRNLKQLFDPKGILNPYKVLPDSTP